MKKKVKRKMNKENKVIDYKSFYLREFQLYDGEYDITFNIVAIDTVKEEITVAITNRGRISVVTYDLLKNENGYYFEYGIYFEKINILDFEEVK
jgi:hypothetical protein